MTHNCYNEECRKKVRTEEEYKPLINRLNRIEGQVRGLKRMLDEDGYCPDILIQVSAISSALRSFSKLLLTQHISTCVKDDLKEGHDETIDELAEIVRKLMN